MSNLIRINNKLMTKNNKLLTANSGSSGLAYNNNLLRFNNYVIDPGSTPVPQLPAYTLRLKYRDDVTPSFSNGTATQVSASPNIWDWTYVNSDWSGVFNGHHDLLEVMDCGDTSGVTSFYITFQNCDSLTSICLLNTSNATSMRGMFWDCEGLTSLPLFNTHNVIDIHDLCYSCRSLTSIPLFDTTNATNVNYMFYDCHRVQSGALALYNQMSTQTNPPSSHSNCFSNCGAATQTGAAELAQIPSSWGGNA